MMLSKNEKIYLFPANERIRHWKDFRTTLTAQQSDIEQLLLVEQYWKQYPYMERILDPYNCSEWPTPWELLHNNEICKIGIAYLMEQTLLLSDKRWSKDRIKLVYIRDEKLSTEFMILMIDTKYVLNYSLNEVVEFETIEASCKILQ